MDQTSKIVSASRRMKHVCTTLIWMLPVCCALFWIFFNEFYRPGTVIPISMIPLPVPVTQELPAINRFFAFLAELIPLAAMLLGLVKLRSLFGCYENGQIFTEQTVKCFRGLGRILIVWVLCNICKTTLLSLILSLPNPPGKRMITVAIGSPEFSSLFIGGVILVITWVMDEARIIKEDQALII